MYIINKLLLYFLLDQSIKHKVSDKSNIKQFSDRG